MEFDYSGLFKSRNFNSTSVYTTYAETKSYEGLTPNLANYYRNKYQDIHDFLNAVQPAINYVKHAKQLLLKIAMSCPDDRLPVTSKFPSREVKIKANIRKILKYWAESQHLILDTTVVQRACGCSRPTARKYIKIIAEMFGVKTVCPKYLKGQPAKKYRISIFELVFSREICLCS